MAVYELRTYTAAPGKIDALHARFANHTLNLFRKHGIESIAYWSDAARPDVLIYLLRFPDEAAMKSAWDAFRADPAWQKAKGDSEVNGVLTAKVESITMHATPYSPFFK